jgi:hypothetical protein
MWEETIKYAHAGVQHHTSQYNTNEFSISFVIGLTRYRPSNVTAALDKF